MTTRRWFLGGTIGMVAVALGELRASADPPGDTPPTCRHTHQCPSGLVCRDDECVPENGNGGDPVLTCVAEIFNHEVTVCLGRSLRVCNLIRRRNRRRACNRRNRRAVLICRTEGEATATITCGPAAA